MTAGNKRREIKTFIQTGPKLEVLNTKAFELGKDRNMSQDTKKINIPIFSSPCHLEGFLQPSLHQLLSSSLIKLSHLTQPVTPDNILLPTRQKVTCKHTGNLNWEDPFSMGRKSFQVSMIIVVQIEQLQKKVIKWQPGKDHQKFLGNGDKSLTKDFIMALLVSSSASLYMSLKNLLRAASPSSFSSFSWRCKQSESANTLPSMCYTFHLNAKEKTNRNSRDNMYTSFFIWASSLSQSFVALEDG